MDKLKKEEFLNLSQEEKEQFVRDLIHQSSEAADIHAAFFNPVTKQTVSMSELAEQIGEDEAVEIILKAMNSITSDMISMGEMDIQQLISKAKRGECSEQELAMLEYVQSQIEAQDNIQFEHNWLDITLNLIDFSQTKVEYNAKVHDLLSATTILVLVSSIFRENGALNKYQNTDPSMMTEIVTQVGNDIYDTWKASCTSLPDPELIILGMLHAASKIAQEHGFEFADATMLANHLGAEICECEECEECDCDDKNENGSNEDVCGCKVCQPVTYNPSESNTTDEEMRDLLKD